MGDDLPNNSRVLLAESGNNRIEIHLKANVDEGTFTLISLTGLSNGEIQRCLRQGPYTTAQQAIAAMQAIGNELQRLDYRLKVCDHPIWALRAQQEVNQMRKTRDLHR